MRRKDMEITAIDDIIEIMDKCDVCRIALFDNEYPYIIPVNFGYSYKNNQLNLYFHGANEGKKLLLIKKNNKVAFEMDCFTNLIANENPCNFTMHYEGLCGTGEIEILNENDKIIGLNYLMNQYSTKIDYNFDNEKVKSIIVLKLKVVTVTGKKSK